RIAVRETGWIGDREFAVALALGQVTPGPVMVVATFIGYRVANLAGALAATFGAFLVPCASAAAMAQYIERIPRHRWTNSFRRGATSAAVGLFGVTALAIARHSLDGWAQFAIAAVAFVLALWTKIHPVWILLGGALLGLVSGTPPAAMHGG